jgi:hypothetical protein
MRGKNIAELGRAHRQHFADKLALFRPQLILLMSTQLMRLIDAPDVVATLSTQLGQLVEPCRWMQGAGRSSRRSHRMGYARFERAPVVGIPHPRVPADSDMSAFGEVIRPLIVEYCERRRLSYSPVPSG